MSVAIDFSDPAVRANPYPIYLRLRSESPVLWNGQTWLISRYDDIIGLLTDERVSLKGEPAREFGHRFRTKLPAYVRKSWIVLHVSLALTN